jgi:hypothetical protein
MSDDDETFRLNSLNRYTKKSRLLLEAHSHCEVPAGCGGAVFQWVNPERGITVRVHVQTPLRVRQVFIDGNAVPGLGLRLLPGSHLLALSFAPREPTQREPNPAAVIDPWALVFLEVRVPGVPTYPVQRIARSESRDDGTWRAFAGTPDPRWNAPDFDDSSWPPLQRSKTAGRDLEKWQRRMFDQELAAGGVPLALPDAHTQLRKRFEFNGGGQR